MTSVNGKRKLVHTVAVNSDYLSEKAAWCQEKFGPQFSILNRKDEVDAHGPHGVWHYVWAGISYNATKKEYGSKTYLFSFDHEADAIMFSLRWL